MKTNMGTVLIIAALVLGGVYLFPWHNIQWGKIETVPQNTITVTGDATTQQPNQIASFNAGVSALNAKKETAVAEVNQKVTELVSSLKTFRVADKDIQTQNLNIYQNPKGFGNPNAGMWQVDNNISITLRDITKAAALTDLLTASGATNINGPNFMADDTQQSEVGLMDKAIKNAREKGQAVAKASGRSLGKVVQVTEGASAGGPILYNAKGMGGGGSPIEPGSQTVSKTVTVTFELK